MVCANPNVSAHLLAQHAGAPLYASPICASERASFDQEEGLWRFLARVTNYDSLRRVPIRFHSECRARRCAAVGGDAPAVESQIVTITRHCIRRREPSVLRGRRRRGATLQRARVRTKWRPGGRRSDARAERSSAHECDQEQAFLCFIRSDFVRCFSCRTAHSIQVAIRFRLRRAIFHLGVALRVGSSVRASGAVPLG